MSSSCLFSLSLSHHPALLIYFTANVAQKVKGTSVIRRMPIIFNYLASHFLRIHGRKKEV